MTTRATRLAPGSSIPFAFGDRYRREREAHRLLCPRTAFHPLRSGKEIQMFISTRAAMALMTVSMSALTFGALFTTRVTADKYRPPTTFTLVEATIPQMVEAME